MEVISLPPDDDMVMPPKGDPLTDKQKSLIRRWILEGASEKPSVNAVQIADSSAPATDAGSSVENSDEIYKPKPAKKATYRPDHFLHMSRYHWTRRSCHEEALAKIAGAKPKRRAH